MSTQLSFLQQIDAADQLGASPTTEAVRQFIARISDRVNADLNPDKKARFSQYFTPAAIAAQMARMIPAGTHALIGDYGAGAGILGATAALFQQALHNSPAQGIHAYEVDETLHRHIRSTMEAVNQFYEGHGSEALALDINGNFLEGVSRIANYSHAGGNLADAIILNPPYKKIGTSTELGQQLKQLGLSLPNMYALFIVIAMTWLKDGGSLVAIVPRSFTNGRYFKTFRSWLRTHGNLDWITRYQSRSNLFRMDNILQENVLIRIRKGEAQQDQIRITVCQDAESDPTMDLHVPATTILPTVTSGIIRVPASSQELASMDKINALTLTLTDLGLGVATGKVEEFRVRHWLQNEHTPNSVPILYAGHWERHETTVTRLGSRVGGKQPFIAHNKATAPKLFPAGYYIVMKRISANDDTSGRIHAALLTPESFPASHFVAIENHVQVIHRQGEGLPPALARGLLAFLRSERVNNCISAISGTTQVNIDDLADLRWPSETSLIKLGKRASFF